MSFVGGIVFFVRALLWNRAAIAAENLRLLPQLAVLCISAKRPRLRRRDRILWVWLSRLWTDWRSCLLIVKPATVTAPARVLTPHEVDVNGYEVNPPIWSRWDGWLEKDQEKTAQPPTKRPQGFQLETSGKTSSFPAARPSQKSFRTGGRG